MLTSNGAQKNGATTNGSDNPVVLIPAQAGSATPAESFVGGAIINETSGVAGFFSLDGWETWARLPAGPSSVTLPAGMYSKGVQFKRIPGGTDITSCFCYLFDSEVS